MQKMTQPNVAGLGPDFPPTPSFTQLFLILVWGGQPLSGSTLTMPPSPLCLFLHLSNRESTSCPADTKWEASQPASSKLGAFGEDTLPPKAGKAVHIRMIVHTFDSWRLCRVSRRLGKCSHFTEEDVPSCPPPLPTPPASVSITQLVNG